MTNINRIELNAIRKALRVLDEDRIWINDSYGWLIATFGYPNSSRRQLQFNASVFQHTFKSNVITADSLVHDVCQLLGLHYLPINIQTVDKITNSHDKSKYSELESDLKPQAAGYTIVVTKQIITKPYHLIHRVILECMRIMLRENEIEFSDYNAEDLTATIGATFFGLGAILCMDPTEQKKWGNNYWENNWQYASNFPEEVLGFILGYYSSLIDQKDEFWPNMLTSGVYKHYFTAFKSFKEVRPANYNHQELGGVNYYSRAIGHYNKNEFSLAIRYFVKVLFYSSNVELKINTYNFIGYCYLRQKEFEKSLEYFNEAIEFIADYGEAYDNLSYALLHLNRLEEALDMMLKAKETNLNNPGYSLRNHAIYCYLKQDYLKSEELFLAALKLQQNIDLLEYHYGKLLLDLGRKSEANDYFQISRAKNEPESDEYLQSLNSN